MGRRDDLQLLFNQQAMSVQGALPTTPRGALMRESGLTPAPVILDSRQQRFAARLANACSSKVNELYQDPRSGMPICRAIQTQHEQGRISAGMSCPALSQEHMVNTVIMDIKRTAKSAAQCRSREKVEKVGAVVWIWWPDWSRSDEGQVGAAVECNHSNEWRTRCGYVCSGHMEVFNAVLWAIGLTLGKMVKRRERLQEHGVKMVAVLSDSQAAIR